MAFLLKCPGRLLHGGGQFGSGPGGGAAVHGSRGQRQLGRRRREDPSAPPSRDVTSLHWGQSPQETEHLSGPREQVLGNTGLSGRGRWHPAPPGPGWGSARLPGHKPHFGVLTLCHAAQSSLARMFRRHASQSRVPIAN